MDTFLSEHSLHLWPRTALVPNTSGYLSPRTKYEGYLSGKMIPEEKHLLIPAFDTAPVKQLALSLTIQWSSPHIHSCRSSQSSHVRTSKWNVNSKYKYANFLVNSTLYKRAKIKQKNKDKRFTKDLEHFF